MRKVKYIFEMNLGFSSKKDAAKAIDLLHKKFRLILKGIDFRFVSSSEKQKLMETENDPT